MQADKSRRPPKTETDREEAATTCRLHLRDLKRAHGRPPADVDLPRVAIPQRPTGEPVGSYCTSAAILCAELVR